jgi:hypothetical protein
MKLQHAATNSTPHSDVIPACVASLKRIYVLYIYVLYIYIYIHTHTHARTQVHTCHVYRT